MPVPTDRPPTDPNQLRIYNGANFLGTVRDWNGRAATVTGYALLVAVATGVLIMLLAAWLFALNPALATMALLAGGGLAGAALMMRSSVGDYRQVAANFARGLQGEDDLAALLMGLPGIDERYALFRNVTLPDGRGDIDAVLVGPRGLYALEVKRWSGNHLYEQSRWYKRQNGAWVESASNPGKQAYANAMRLQDYLAARGVPVRVAPRLVWCSGFVELRDNLTPVWFINGTDWILRDLAAGTHHDVTTLQHVEALLAALHAPQ